MEMNARSLPSGDQAMSPSSQEAERPGTAVMGRVSAGVCRPASWISVPPPVVSTTHLLAVRREGGLSELTDFGELVEGFPDTGIGLAWGRIGGGLGERRKKSA